MVECFHLSLERVSSSDTGVQNPSLTLAPAVAAASSAFVVGKILPNDLRALLRCTIRDNLGLLRRRHGTLPVLLSQWQQCVEQDDWLLRRYVTLLKPSDGANDIQGWNLERPCDSRSNRADSEPLFCN